MRVLFVSCLLLLGCTASHTPGTSYAPNCAWRICVTSEDARAGRTYRAENAEPVPATVVLTFRALENLRSPEGRRVERVIPPHSVAFVELDAIRPGRSFGARMAVSIDLGASTTVPDDYVYAVPFGGSVARPLTQGYDGGSTHVGSMRYSLDFLMPTGTPVLAAREGTVLYVQDGFTEGAADPALLEEANLVVVAHEDGTMASYGHLAAGVNVSVGEAVAEGELLGFSGQTGFAGRPHLHFHVGLRMLGEPGRTVPVAMRDGEGRLLDLVNGAMIPPATQHP